MRLADLRGIGLFDGLSDDQLAELAAAGDEVPVRPGVELFREGRHAGREDRVVGRMDVPGRWAGGFRAWDEHGVYLATGRGVTPGRVLRVPAAGLRKLSDAWF